jgi:hypothetical protein
MSLGVPVNTSSNSSSTASLAGLALSTAPEVWIGACESAEESILSISADGLAIPGSENSEEGTNSVPTCSCVSTALY